MPSRPGSRPYGHFGLLSLLNHSVPEGHPPWCQGRDQRELKGQDRYRTGGTCRAKRNGRAQGPAVPSLFTAQANRLLPVCITQRLAGRRQRCALPQKSMPPPGMAGAAGAFFFGSSAMSASVVISRPEMEAASCSAVRTTLVGSMMPDFTMSTYSPVWAL